MPAKQADLYSAEEDETLVRMIEEGFSATLISRKLGKRSRSSVLGRAHRLGLRLERKPARDMARRPKLRRRRPRIVVEKRSQQEMAMLRAAEAGVAPGKRLRFTKLGLGRRKFLWPAEAGCRHLEGEPTQYLWCNVVKDGESSYCAFHRAMYEKIYDRSFKKTGLPTNYAR